LLVGHDGPVGKRDPHRQHSPAHCRRLHIGGPEIEEVAPFRGFLAPPTFPVARSAIAKCRSPSRPISVTSEAFSSSPIIDFTGYRPSAETEPLALVLTEMAIDRCAWHA
jgi:hypothetical protein